MLKNILSWKFSSALCCFLFSMCAIGSFPLKRYGYGKLNHTGIPAYWPKGYIGGSSFSAITNHEGKGVQLKHKFNVELLIKNNNQSVIATVKFTNKSIHNYFIHISNLPYHHDKENPDLFYALCQNAFHIFTGNIDLEYLGSGCEFDYDLFEKKEFEMDEWVKISAKSTKTFNVILNGSYIFLPGSHEYEMATANYMIVDDRWFTQNHINDLIFSVVDFNYQECELWQQPVFVYKSGDICSVDPWRENTFHYFMSNAFPYNKYNDSFKVKSDKVFISIDGDKTTSFYNLKARYRS